MTATQVLAVEQVLDAVLDALGGVDLRGYMLALGKRKQWGPTELRRWRLCDDLRYAFETYQEGGR